MTGPTHLNPFVLPVDPRPVERIGTVDVYPPDEYHLPDPIDPRPAVLFVHGPVQAGQQPTPRDWPMFRAYGSLVAARGFVGATVDHRLHSLADYPLAAEDVAAAVDLLRADPRVDADRIALWVFSGGGPLLADWLREPPAWLRCVAATYPILALPPELAGERFQPAQAVAGAGSLPIVLTRVGREHPGIAATVEAFVAAARTHDAALTIVDVPDGQHAFDILDPGEQSRAAIREALQTVLATLA